MVRRVTTELLLALAYVSIGIAPLVYAYLTVREEEERTITKADRSIEPTVHVHVVVVVNDEDVEVKKVETTIAQEEDTEASILEAIPVGHNIIGISANSFKNLGEAIA